jgi:hypothetical protein
VQLSRTRPPYTIPSYSLTGDLLAYLNCGLQYRYQNRGALPPSTPVQLWFGEFIHAVMEEAYLRWSTAVAPGSFPWDWTTTIRPIELEIFRRLRARGLAAPFNLFCPSDGTASGPRCTCSDPSRQQHRLLASRRAEAAINAWAAHLFPLISEAEVNVRGIRDMPVAGSRRADYYEVSGVIDVLGAVQIAASPPGNLLLHHLNGDAAVAGTIAGVGGANYEIILDYKGMRRPGTTTPEWTHLAWQVHTYAWLRGQQAGAAPVVAAILLFVNELEPSQEDMVQLKREVQAGTTDVMPGRRDRALIEAWRRGRPVPALSTTFREQRSIRVVSVDGGDITTSLSEFDDVVGDIEQSVLVEMSGGSVIHAWQSRPSGRGYTAPDVRICTACDHKHYCPLAPAAGFGSAPQGP